MRSRPFEKKCQDNLCISERLLENILCYKLEKHVRDAGCGHNAITLYNHCRSKENTRGFNIFLTEYFVSVRILKIYIIEVEELKIYKLSSSYVLKFSEKYLNFWHNTPFLAHLFGSLDFHTNKKCQMFCMPKLNQCNIMSLLLMFQFLSPKILKTFLVEMKLAIVFIHR